MDTDNMTPELAMVSEFMDTFDTPTNPEFWVGLVYEELAELEEALENVLKEMADLQYVLGGAVLSGADEAVTPSEELKMRMERVLDLCDYGIPNVARGAAFYEVHRSNMSKLMEDGSVLRRADGKVLKGPNYTPANMTRVLELL